MKNYEQGTGYCISLTDNELTIRADETPADIDMRMMPVAFLRAEVVGT